ncbi:hypothetical protein D3C85_1114860 [compost metagenome]
MALFGISQRSRTRRATSQELRHQIQFQALATSRISSLVKQGMIVSMLALVSITAFTARVVMIASMAVQVMIVLMAARAMTSSKATQAMIRTSLESALERMLSTTTIMALA